MADFLRSCAPQEEEPGKWRRILRQEDLAPRNWKRNPQPFPIRIPVLTSRLSATVHPTPPVCKRCTKLFESGLPRPLTRPFANCCRVFEGIHILPLSAVIAPRSLLTRKIAILERTSDSLGPKRYFRPKGLCPILCPITLKNRLAERIHGEPLGTVSNVPVTLRHANGSAGAPSHDRGNHGEGHTPWDVASEDERNRFVTVPQIASSGQRAIRASLWIIGG